MTGISVDPPEIELTRDGPSQNLYVIGHYDDAIDRDITHSALGTTYQSSNNNVATVSIDGLVTSVGFGSCTITVTNTGFTDTAQVEVTGLPCPGDVNFDNAVDVNDLLLVINSWGTCYACPADTNLDGVVNVDDMLTVLNHWGPCPEPQKSDEPNPNYDCIDEIKWQAYLDVLTNGTVEEVKCWNCWAYWRLCVCAGQCPNTPPECGCVDPF